MEISQKKNLTHFEYISKILETLTLQKYFDNFANTLKIVCRNLQTYFDNFANTLKIVCRNLQKYFDNFANTSTNILTILRTQFAKNLNLQLLNFCETFFWTISESHLENCPVWALSQPKWKIYGTVLVLAAPCAAPSIRRPLGRRPTGHVDSHL